jgi:hypothetical protein
MATTLEMFLASLALIINTFIIGLMYFLGNAILSPFLDAVGKYVDSSQAIPMWDMTYIIPAIWGILLIMEIIIIIAFFVVIARRTVVDDFL